MTKNAEKIKKIDPRIYRIAQKNKLNLKDTMLLNETVKNTLVGNKKTNAQIYKETKARNPSTMSDLSASVGYNDTLKNPKMEKSLQEVLTDSNITKKSIIDTHKDILNQSMASEQYNVSRNCNRDFMELSKMLDPETKQPTTINLTQINNYTVQELNDKLNDIINGDIDE